MQVAIGKADSNYASDVTSSITSLSILKSTGNNAAPTLITRTLTTELMIYLNKNQHLCNNPSLLKEKIANKKLLEK